MNKSGAELSLTVIIVAIILIIVLVVVVVIFGSKISIFGKSSGSCQTQGGQCETAVSGTYGVSCQEGETRLMATCEDTSKICCIRVLK